MLPTGLRRDLEGPTREQSSGSAAFHQLREYVPGDDLRLIHWKSSAKTGTLVVKQMVDTTRPEILVIIDNRRIAMSEIDFEDAVDIAASILEAAEQDGFPHQLLFADGDNGPHADGVQAGFLERLTAITLSDSDSLAELSEALRARGRSLVYITGELPPHDMALVARIARDFNPAYIVSVVKERSAPFVVPPWVKAVPCGDALEFSTTWSKVR